MPATFSPQPSAPPTWTWTRITSRASWTPNDVRNGVTSGSENRTSSMASNFTSHQPVARGALRRPAPVDGDLTLVHQLHEVGVGGHRRRHPQGLGHLGVDAGDDLHERGR